MNRRRAVKKGEPLAIMAEALHAGPGAMWWDMPVALPANERHGDVEVVSVRGSLEHHSGLGCDSYDDIMHRVADAFAGCHDDEGPETPPKAVILRLDSPGGVVSGLNQAVFAIRKMSAESGIPLIAYVDELAASAAYAMACACDTIVLPPSAITGSVGVISTLYDQVEADKKMGVRFVTLTSGERKADGHPHVEISADALDAEQRRVDRLAKQFYRLVADVRQISPKQIASLQAGIFLGQEAVGAGLADEVMGWDELLAALNDSRSVNQKPVDALRQSGSSKTHASPTEAHNMSLAAFSALVKRTKAKLAAEKDAKKKKALAVNLAKYEAAAQAYKKEKHTVEKHETEEGDEEDEEESSEESESEEEESSEAKGNETDRKEGDDDSDGDDDDDGDSDDEEDEDEEAESKKSAKSLAALAQQVTGKRGRAAVGALTAMLAQGQRAAAMVDKIANERRAEKKIAAIDTALNARRITRSEAKLLRDKPLSFVRSFLEMRPKAIINVDDDSIRIPDPNAEANATDGLPAELVKSIAVAASAAPDAKSREALRTKMIQEHQKRMSALNGAAGRH